MNKGFGKETFKCSVMDNVENMFRRITDETTLQQVFQAVAYAVKDVIIDEWIVTHKEYEKKDVRTIYYLPMEFLMGRTLGNNTISICIRDKIKEALDEMGPDLNVIEDQEPDATLENGGLRRLTACSLNPLAIPGYPAYDCGICYRYGIFRQKTENDYQAETPDNWLKDGNPLEIRRPEYATEVKLRGYVYAENQGGVNHFVRDGYQSVRAAPYGLPVTGYGDNMVNAPRIWDAEPINIPSLGSFDRGDYQKAVEQENLVKTIVEVLYPNDNHYTGKELRLKQQYFFISISVQRAVRKYREKRGGIRGFYEKVVFQLNDTHPAAATPELIRILLNGGRLTWDGAWEATTRTCAHTNYTIMSETLEKWPIELFLRLLPRTYQTVEEINHRFRNQIQTIYPGNWEKLRRMSIIYNGRMKMAYIVIATSSSANGVAGLHTEILKHQELKDFYEMMPKKFNNKTNGMTQGRFLLHGNPLLADWVTSKIGDEWIVGLLYIRKLELSAEDEEYQSESMNIKYQSKPHLIRYIKESNDIDVDPRSIFDVRTKRLHKYERQLMNILHVTYLYNQLRDNPGMDMISRTFIFGAKVATDYKRTKLTIKLTSPVVDVVNNDRSISGKIRVVFVKDYRISNARLMFAAIDVSEQVSTISKEASDASNMKFMLNGALTLGTMNGANVEIVEEMGVDNVSVLGISSDEVIDYENNGGYYPIDTSSNDQGIRHVLMQLTNGCYTPDNPELFRNICNSLLNTKSNDRTNTYFIPKDLRSYTGAHQRVDKTYRDQAWWAKAVILNMANCRRFTSDRTIEGYAKNT